MKILRDRIIEYFEFHNQARAHDLWRELLPISRASIHKQLKKLVDDGILEKIGKAPHVFYVPSQEKKVESTVQIPQEILEIIDKQYLYISPQGELKYGSSGFFLWLRETKQEKQSERLALKYVQTLSQYNQYRINDGWIDASFKMEETFPDVFLDELLYADFYSYPQFGKTKLGTLMLYAKQSQNRELITLVADAIKTTIHKIIHNYAIDAVAFIPPSVPRTIQFQYELSLLLRLPKPIIQLVKTKTGQVIVPQKTLEKLEERITNARNTIFMKDTNIPYRTILLVDDAVGSGASMNETARKIKQIPGFKGRVVGFAIVGSFKGFEVLKEI